MAGAIGAMGFHTPRPDDLMGWEVSNPEHWESDSLTALDDLILSRFEGRWDAPPDFAIGWTDDTEVLQVSNDDAQAALIAAYPFSGPCVWKDPRNCLLLPFWLRVLPQPVAAILVWRQPLNVARSLAKRDDFHLADGIALWERYNRAALEALEGLDTYVVTYESLLHDPGATLGGIATWLGSLEQFRDLSVETNLPRAVATVVSPTEKVERPSGDGDELLQPEQHKLMKRLTDLAGPPDPLQVSEHGDESGWTTALLAARRTAYKRELQKLTDQLNALTSSTTWRITRPVRKLAAFVSKMATRTVQQSRR